MWDQITLSGFADEISPDLNEQMRVVKKLGIHHIEMRGVDGKGLVDYSLDDVKEIKRRLDAEGLWLSSVGSPIGKISIKDPMAPHLEKLKHTIEIAHIMDVKNVRMFSFFMPEGEDPASYQGEVFDRMGQMVDLAVSEDAILLHENEKDIYGDIAVRCLELMKEFYGPHFKGVFDFANFVQCGQDTVEAYEMLRPYIQYIHIKDALSSTGEVVPAGLGDGHVEELLKRFRDSEYRGFLSLEPHLADFGGFNSLERGKSIVPKKLTGEEAYTLAYESLMRILEKL